MTERATPRRSSPQEPVRIQGSSAVRTRPELLQFRGRCARVRAVLLQNIQQRLQRLAERLHEVRKGHRYGGIVVGQATSPIV